MEDQGYEDSYNGGSPPLARDRGIAFFILMIEMKVPTKTASAMLPKTLATLKLLLVVSGREYRDFERPLSNLDTDSRLEHQPLHMKHENHSHPRWSFCSCGILLDST